MEQNHFNDLVDHTKEYVHTQSEIIKLKLVDKTGRTGGVIASYVFFLVILVTVFLFLSVSAALVIGEWTGKYHYGFLAVAGSYAVIGLVFYVNRDRWIKGPFADRIVRSILTENDNG